MASPWHPGPRDTSWLLRGSWNGCGSGCPPSARLGICSLRTSEWVASAPLGPQQKPVPGRAPESGSRMKEVRETSGAEEHVRGPQKGKQPSLSSAPTDGKYPPFSLPSAAVPVSLPEATNLGPGLPGLCAPAFHGPTPRGPRVLCTCRGRRPRSHAERGRVEVVLGPDTTRAQTSDPKSNQGRQVCPPPAAPSSSNGPSRQRGAQSPGGSRPPPYSGQEDWGPRKTSESGAWPRWEDGPRPRGQRWAVADKAPLPTFLPASSRTQSTKEARAQERGWEDNGWDFTPHPPALGPLRPVGVRAGTSAGGPVAERSNCRRLRPRCQGSSRTGFPGCSTSALSPCPAGVPARALCHLQRGRGGREEPWLRRQTAVSTEMHPGLHFPRAWPGLGRLAGLLSLLVPSLV